MTTISVRVDDNTKKQAEALFEGLGMNMSTAVNIFLNATIREQGFPFAVSINPSQRPKISEEELFLAIAKHNIMSHQKAYKELAE